jgi:LysM repeat protein
MKPTLLFTTLSMILATSPAFAKSELETLRSLCAEQERQIRQLEVENSRLRSDTQEEKAPVAQKAVAGTADRPESTYTVKAGDSFEKIAGKVGTTPEKLVKSNGLKATSIIQPGQKLKVPGASAPTAAATPVTPTPARQETSGGRTHTIRQGETYSSISRKYKISTAALVAANPTVKATALRPGQVIKIGGSSSSTSLISAPAAQAKAPAPVIEETPPPASVPVAPAAESTEVKPTPAAPPVVHSAPPETETTPVPATAAATATTTDKKFRPITIDGEMTYGEFAAKHGTDAERLNALNGLDLTTATVLAKGSELYVPAQP